MRATSQSITKIINHQIVRFALVGLIITLLNFLLYNFFVYALNLSPGLSTILAFCVLIPPHLMSNWRWVFKATDKNKFWLILKYSFALCFLALSNYLAVQFFWAYLLLDPAPSQFLNLAVNVPVSYFLFKYLVFREPSTSKTSIEIIIFILACLFAYLIILHSLTGVFTYTNVIPVKDDWRHLNDYLFEKSLWESIFDRQNNHLMILPNLFFLANLYILNGQTSNLAFLNIGLWGASGLIIAFLANKHITKTSNKLGPLFLTLCILAIMFVITSSSTQFWGIGIHNHFVVFFATVCAFVLSAGSQQISSLKTVSFFVVLAFLASASFSTGLALWALGGAAAISQKNSLRVIFTYIIIGIIGILLLKPSSSASLSLPSLPYLIEFIALFIGNSFVSTFFASAPIESKITISLYIGALGLLIYAGLTATIFYHGWKKSTLNIRWYRFAYLMMSFVLVAGVFVCLGRQQDLGTTLALYPRFSTWSAYFWNVTFIFVMVLIYTKTAKSPRSLYVVPLISVLVAVYLINEFSLFRGVYKHNHETRSVVQIINNANERPLARALFRKNSALVLKVTRELENRRKNLYSDKLHKTVASNTFIETPTEVCHGTYRKSGNLREAEVLLRGNIIPSKSMNSIYQIIINYEEKNIGVGLPGAGGLKQTNNWEPQGPFLWNIYRKILPLNMAHMPGLSKSWVGTIRHPEVGDKTFYENINLYAMDRNGNTCILKQ